MPWEPCGVGQEGAGSWEMGLGQAEAPVGEHTAWSPAANCNCFARSSLIPELVLFCGHEIFAVSQAPSTNAQQAS